MPTRTPRSPFWKRGLIKVNSSVERIRAILQEQNTEDPINEFELAVQHLRGVGFAEDEFNRIVQGIVSNTPITRVIGYNIVCGARIMLDEHVLSPGPETIEIVKATIAIAKNLKEPCVLDMCTGSGAIAIAVAKNVPGSRCVGVDVSKDALNVARKNARDNQTQVDFRQGDLFDPVTGDAFDLIIANPPYVRSGKISELPHFVRDFTPILAIDGGPDGLRLHERIIQNSRSFLRPGGFLILECEDDQDVELQDLFDRYKWTIAESYQNRLGKTRGFCLSLSSIKGPSS